MDDDNVFADKYVLLRKLGEGGMAEIFLARQLGLGGFAKELVIKRIHRELATNERYVELFLDEARIAANLNHPHIVHIYDIGKALGTYYIAMEYIQGKDLMEICRKGIAEKQFLPLRYAVKIISLVAQGLHYAHAHADEHGRPVGIVHRDISPTNILVSYQGLPKVVDFGIAKAATQVHDDSGAVMGKLNYMAPEQLRGEPVDGRSDLFSLGVVLYEITVGRRLFKGKGEEVKRRILSEPVPPPSLVRPDYPPDLEVIVMRLLEARPENRYPDAAELHQDLEEFLVEMGWKVGTHHLSRYLAELFDVSGVGIEVEDSEELDDEEDDLDFDRQASGTFDSDFGEDDGQELIFASRMPDPLLDAPTDPDDEAQVADHTSDPLLDPPPADDTPESGEALLEAAVRDIAGEAGARGAAPSGGAAGDHGPDWAGDVVPRRRSWPLIIAVCAAAAICLSLILMYFDVI